MNKNDTSLINFSFVFIKYTTGKLSKIATDHFMPYINETFKSIELKTDKNIAATNNITVFVNKSGKKPNIFIRNYWSD